MKQIYSSYREKKAYDERVREEKELEILSTKNPRERMDLYFKLTSRLKKEIYKNEQ